MRLVALAGARDVSSNEPGVADATFSGSSSSCPVRSSQTAQVPSTSLAFLIDTVMLRDADNAPGYYAVLVPYGNGSWSGGVLYKDAGFGYNAVQSFNSAGIAGVLVTGITPTEEVSWDETTVLTVDLYGTTAVLESLTEAEVLAGGNAFCLGDGLIGQFRDANQVGGFSNRWNLTELLWARRGSGFALGSFSAGARFVLLDDAVRFIQEVLTERGIARNFKGVTSGYTVTDAASTSFTWDARTLKPLSPVDVQGSRDGSNNLTITWVRRSRIGQDLPYDTGMDPPLGEDTEAYEVDIWNGSSVVRTITASSPTASYSAAEQTTDGLTPGDPVTVRVYQMSVMVGRGFVREATI
jgi:hypothetical protein